MLPGEGDGVVGGLLVGASPVEHAPVVGEKGACGGVVAAEGVGLAEDGVQQTQGRPAADGRGLVGEHVRDREGGGTLTPPR